MDQVTLGIHESVYDKAMEEAKKDIKYGRLYPLISFVVVICGSLLVNYMMNKSNRLCDYAMTTLAGSGKYETEMRIAKYDISREELFGFLSGRVLIESEMLNCNQ